MSILNEPRNIGKHNMPVVIFIDSQPHMHGGKGIVTDTGIGIGDGAQKAGFSRIGTSHNAHIGNDLKAQTNGALLARLTPLSKTRRALDGTFEMGIAIAASAATTNAVLFAFLIQIGKEQVSILTDNLTSQWDIQHQWFGMLATAIFACPIAAAPSFEVRTIAKVNQSVQSGIGL